MLGCLGALKIETATLRRRMTAKSVSIESSCHMIQGTYQGKPLVLATTGMGRQRAEAAARLMLDRYPISLLVSFGFAGALTDELAIGDVVLGSPWHAKQDAGDEAGPSHSLVVDEPTLSLAAQALQNAAIPFRVAGGVTAPDILCDPEEKRAMAEAYAAHIVDMESYWIGTIASERRIPFLSVRMISDTKTEGLLPFTQMMTLDGRWKAKETARYFIQCPQHVSTLLGMAGKIRRARQNLARAIDGVVDGLGTQ